MRKILSVEHDHSTVCDDIVRLDHDQRTRRRMVFTTERGNAILLDLRRPGHIRDGDVLRLDDGASVKVQATAEPLLEISAPSIPALVRIAWHLGNRHLPTQLLPGENGGTLRIRHDHVIADMVEGLGGQCLPVLAPFDPEGGAYARNGESGHGHSDGHGHQHHAHSHAHHG